MDRKFRAKRANEHVKAVYALANTIAAAIVVTAFVAPAITRGTERLNLDAPGWVVIGLAVHVAG